MCDVQERLPRAVSNSQGGTKHMASGVRHVRLPERVAELEALGRCETRLLVVADDPLWHAWQTGSPAKLVGAICAETFEWGLFQIHGHDSP